MWNIDPVQIQQYYERQVTLREVTYERGRVKKEVKVDVVDVLSTQE
jgi:hypothetical protein